jgi:hypothetical protein
LQNYIFELWDNGLSVIELDGDIDYNAFVEELRTRGEYTNIQLKEEPGRIG